MALYEAFSTVLSFLIESASSFFFSIYLRHTGSSIFLLGICDLVPRLGIEPRPPALTAQSLTTVPLGKSLDSSNMGFWIEGLLLRVCLSKTSVFKKCRVS